jgi:LacI family transcriptional regulator
MNGYILALQNYQIPVEEDLILHPDFSKVNIVKPKNLYIRGDSTYYDVGYEEMKKLIVSNKPLPEAIFFATDICAFGAMKAMEEAGLRVPEDIAFMGFDDEYPSDYGCDCKQISSMHQPLKEAGYYGIKTLIHNLENPELEKEKIVLKTQLIIRDSSIKRN